ncbi:hypothetical protein DFP72DRAFT_565951 [Ephemerocybe angulata]|uniref:Uncharacterized protein n=1 Tax=Ephemerocybe angulata TaxID=980116 RepID=A0A8H6IC47_9AGAR|nr:hypothetical protein DFP72DRAFT_565951 [Tulosesus angulatus]
MSFSASLRRCAPSAARILRQEATFQNAVASSSTQAASKKQTRQTRSALPREKLRALVSLYHQADTFITQENLIEKINEALLNETKERMPSRRCPHQPSCTL